jgi:SAM-dependent methyltransferase
MTALLGCPHGCGALRLADAAHETTSFLVSAELHCERGAHQFRITDGIVRLLEVEQLDKESENERIQRDKGAAGLDASWEQSPFNQAEIVSTLRASEPLAHALVLELGAGTGRYTVPMAERGAAVLAVDMSGGSLATLAHRVRPGWQVGLVQADCTRPMTRARAFDLVASTLMSNIPTKDQRLEVMRVAAAAVKHRGKFVFGTHYYGLGSWVRGEKKSGYYREAPIYRYMYRRGEIKRETRRFFAAVRCHPVRIALPFMGRLGRRWVTVSQKLEQVPVLNQFGDLLLVVAEDPRNDDE